MVEPVVLAGVALSLVGALTWATHYLLIRLGTDEGTVGDAVVVALICNLVVLVPPAIVLEYPDYDVTARSAALFTLAGLTSGVLGRIAQYRSTDVVGASRTSPVVASAGLLSSLLAVAVLGESLTVPHLMGILLIVVGVAVTSLETIDREAETVEQLRLLALPLLAALCYAVEPILVKRGLATGTSFPVGMAIMIVSAAVGYIGLRTARGGVFTRGVPRRREMGYFVAAGLAGAAAFVAYYAALDVAPVVVVMPVLQTTPLLVVVLSLLFIPQRLEHVTRRLVYAASLVVVGTTVVTVFA